MKTVWHVLFPVVLVLGCRKTKEQEESGGLIATPAPAAQEKIVPTNPPGGTLKGKITFATLRPYLKAHCTKCHGDRNLRMGGLDLTSYESAMKARQGGPIIIPGHPEKSCLVEMITGTKTFRGTMPDRGPMLPLGDVQAISDWIKDGAKEK